MSACRHGEATLPFMRFASKSRLESVGPQRNLQKRVTDVWGWLPAFRAVAELEHVQNAAKRMHITASSLSRAIALLEDRLGHQLFDRVGRNIKLNREGETMLVAAREAMRRVDDGIAQVTDTQLTGELRVACEGDQPSMLASRAAAALRKSHATISTTVEPTPSKQALVSKILRGDLDVALVTAPLPDPRVRIELLGEVSYGIYCGRSHPLFARRTVTLERLREHAFVAPSEPSTDGPGDGWPKAEARVVALRLPSMQAAIATCTDGDLLAVLPDITVAQAVKRRELRRLPSGFIESVSLFIVRRHPTEKASIADAFVASLRAQSLSRRE